MNNKYQIGDIFVFECNKRSSKDISTITGYGYKPHFKCFCYDVQKNYIGRDGIYHIRNYEIEEATLRNMVDRGGYIHFPVVK